MQFNRTSVNISHCELSENFALTGSAVLFDGKYCTLNVSHTKIAKNNYRTKHSMETYYFGSAVYVLSAARFLTSWVDFQKNLAAGAVSMAYASGEINQCNFYKNHGVLWGALSTTTFSTTLPITNCNFSGNYGASGVSLHLANQVTLIQNCQFDEFFGETFLTIKIHGRKTLNLRLYGNIFHKKNQARIGNTIQLESTLPTRTSAELYFCNNTVVMTRKNVFHDISIKNLLDAVNINLIARNSKFASGRFTFHFFSNNDRQIIYLLGTSWHVSSQTEMLECVSCCPVLTLFYNFSSSFTVSG